MYIMAAFLIFSLTLSPIATAPSRRRRPCE